MMRTVDCEGERKMTDVPRACSTVSRDGGRTWSPARPEFDLWNAKAKAFCGRAADGRCSCSDDPVLPVQIRFGKFKLPPLLERRMGLG